MSDWPVKLKIKSLPILSMCAIVCPAKVAAIAGWWATVFGWWMSMDLMVFLTTCRRSCKRTVSTSGSSGITSLQYTDLQKSKLSAPQVRTVNHTNSLHLGPHVCFEGYFNELIRFLYGITHIFAKDCLLHLIHDWPSCHVPAGKCVVCHGYYVTLDCECCNVGV